MSREITTLPSNGDVSKWSEAEKAIVDAAGLVFTHTYGDRKGQREAAPRPVVEQFLSLARRSGLDPLARQIYCIGRLSGDGRVEWSIQTGIDGFRLVAERSGKYAGQDPAEWFTEKGEWVDAFVPSLHGDHPLAARVKVYRSDWPRPAVAVAEWGAYAQTKKNGDLNQMWSKQGPGQLAKCAEALAIRKAFPQDLSGLYTADELGEVVAVTEPGGRDFKAEIDAAQTHEAVEDLLDAADDAGVNTDTLRTAALTRHGILGREDPVDAEIVEQPAGSAGSREDARRDGERSSRPGEQLGTEHQPSSPTPRTGGDMTEDEYERITAAEYAAAKARGEA